MGLQRAHRASAKRGHRSGSGPGYLPQTGVDVRLRTMDQTHRRVSAAFVALRAFVEPVGSSVFRSVN
jgi:hypothetical protein